MKDFVEENKGIFAICATVIWIFERIMKNGYNAKATCSDNGFGFELVKNSNNFIEE